MKTTFHDIIQEQNINYETEKEETNRIEIQYINSFFDTTKEPPSLISFNCQLPNFNQLILPRNIWNFDILKISKELYEGLKLIDYIDIQNQLTTTGNEEEETEQDECLYGPVHGKGLLEKLKEDFIYCFNETKKAMKLEVDDFEYKYWGKQYSSNTIYAFHLINDSVRYKISWKFISAYNWHIPYIKSYINRNLEYHKELVDCFVQTIRKILEYWNDVVFHLHQNLV